MSFPSLLGPQKRILLNSDLSSCGPCVYPTRKIAFKVTKAELTCICASSGLFIGNDLTIEAQYTPPGLIYPINLGTRNNSNMVIVPTNRATVGITVKEDQIVYYFPIDQISTKNDDEDNLVYLTTESAGTYDVKRTTGSNGKVTMTSLIVVGMSSLSIQSSNPGHLNGLYIEHSETITRSSLDVSIDTTYSTLISTENKPLDTSTETKTITVNFSSHQNSRIPMMYGKIPYDTGIYYWKPEPESSEESSLDALEITGIVIGSVIGVVFIALIFMYCYFKRKSKQIEGKL